MSDTEQAVQKLTELKADFEAAARAEKPRGILSAVFFLSHFYRYAGHKMCVFGVGDAINDVKSPIPERHVAARQYLQGLKSVFEEEAGKKQKWRIVFPFSMKRQIKTLKGLSKKIDGVLPLMP